MKPLISVLLLAILGVPLPASAETTGEAMRAFGIIGTWSPDCSVLPTRPCEGQGAAMRCGVRNIYTAPIWGAPTRQEFLAIPGINDPLSPNLIEIDEATRITEDKLRITFTIRGSEGVSGDASEPQKGEVWEAIIKKIGNRITDDSMQRIDGKKILSRNGYHWVPKGVWNPSQIPTEYEASGTATLVMERCLN